MLCLLQKQSCSAWSLDSFIPCQREVRMQEHHPQNVIWSVLGRRLMIIITHDCDISFETRSFLIEMLLFYLLLKTSIQCTFHCGSKAKNCQVILSYVNKNQSSTIMKAAYNMLLYFLCKQILPRLFPFLNSGRTSSVSPLLLWLFICVHAESSSVRTSSAEPALRDAGGHAALLSAARKGRLGVRNTQLQAPRALALLRVWENGSCGGWAVCCDEGIEGRWGIFAAELSSAS